MGRAATMAMTAAGALALTSIAWVADAQQAAPPAEGPSRLILSGRATSLAEERRALNEAKAQAARARAQSGRMEARARAATAEADKLNAGAAALAARIQASEAELREGAARLAIVNRLIAGEAALLARQQGPLIRLTAALQSFSRRPPVLALVQPGSLADTVHVRAAFSHVLPAIRRRTAALRTELARTRQLRAMAVQADRALRDGQVKLARQREALQRLEGEKRLAAMGFLSGAGVEAERAMAMSERVRDIDELMERMEAAGTVRDTLAALPGPQLRPARAGAIAAPPEGGAEQGRRSTPAYRLPVVGAIVTGMGELSDSGVRARGITVATAPGAQLIAPAAGRIAFAGPYKGFGQIVIIDHGDGWTSLLTGMARLSVSVGQAVDQGEPLGVAGSGDHPAVTIELRRQGRPIDILALAQQGG